MRWGMPGGRVAILANMRLQEATYRSAPALDDEVSDRIFTAANVITFARLCLIPISVVLLVDGQNLAAACLFGIAAATDFLDGMVARKTHTVTRLGQVLDPVVDRVLIIAAVLGLLLAGLLPVWIVILVVLRDVYLLAGGAYLLKGHGIRIPVSYIGKTGMWFLCIGCAGLILNLPIVPGAGICDISWLPGFNADPCCAFIWVVYIGLALALAVTVVYTYQGIRAFRRRSREGGGAA